MIQAQKVRRQVVDDFDRVFALPNPLRASTNAQASNAEDKGQGVDVLLTPTTPGPPPMLSEVMSEAEKGTVAEYTSDVFTVPASLAGLPAISVPVALASDDEEGSVRTTGMQIVAQFGDEEMVFRVAELVEGLGA